MAEKCVTELGDELLHICPEGGTITPLSLAVVTANLNTCISNRGLSPFNATNSLMHRSPFLTSKLLSNSTPCGSVIISLVGDPKPLAAVLALPCPFKLVIWFTYTLVTGQAISFHLRRLINKQRICFLELRGCTNWQRIHV